MLVAFIFPPPLPEFGRDWQKAWGSVQILVSEVRDVGHALDRSAWAVPLRLTNTSPAPAMLGIVVVRLVPLEEPTLVPFTGNPVPWPGSRLNQISLPVALKFAPVIVI